MDVINYGSESKYRDFVTDRTYGFSGGSCVKVEELCERRMRS